MSLCKQALEVLQLGDAVLQRFGAARIKGLPGALHGLLLLRHPVKTENLFSQHVWDILNLIHHGPELESSRGGIPIPEVSASDKSMLKST